MFYAVVDSNMKIIAGIGAIVLFHDSVYWPQMVGFACIFLSLLATSYDKKLKYDEEKKEAGKTGLLFAHNSSETSGVNNSGDSSSDDADAETHLLSDVDASIA